MMLDTFEFDRELQIVILPRKRYAGDSQASVWFICEVSTNERIRLIRMN